MEIGFHVSYIQRSFFLSASHGLPGLYLPFQRGQEPSQFPPIFQHFSPGPLTGPLSYPLLVLLPHPTHYQLHHCSSASGSQSPEVLYTPCRPGSDGILMLLHDTFLRQDSCFLTTPFKSHIFRQRQEGCCKFKANHTRAKCGEPVSTNQYK